MPPHFSLRTELQAFYAALLRTVCLSAEAFRKVCRWDLQRRFTPEPPRPAAAPVGSPLNAAQAQQAAAETLQRTAAGARPARRVERIPPPSHKLTATAVAIGGAVLLTWIVASHAPFGDGKNNAVLHTPAPPASNRDESASVRLSDERARHDLATSAAPRADQYAPASTPATAARSTAMQTAAANATRRQSPASSPIIVTPGTAPAPAVARGPATSTASGPAKAERPDFAARTNPGAPLRGTLTSKATRTNGATASATKGRQAVETGTRSAHGESRRHPAHDFTPHRSAPLVTTQRTQGAYSEASGYSPFQPGGMSSSDYSSLSTYAGTRAAPRPTSSATVNVDNTDWVNHVSQRRVTEVPDHFAK
ncbi:hypothetical protein P5W99_10710 [Paraburkholderia sp. A3BS-1L]|uniref:hypothetical protein n=1 Tax=Paraburkholderia sp. A3BS-1L TaxID=3028375 RepID=UPI003DA7C8BB